MPERIDIATFAGEVYGDAWEAMAESYAEVATMFVAVLQEVGPIILPPDAIERAAGMVIAFDPIGRKGAFRVHVVPRSEGGADPAAVDRLRERWERQYVRREGTAAS